MIFKLKIAFLSPVPDLGCKNTNKNLAPLPLVDDAVSICFPQFLLEKPWECLVRLSANPKLGPWPAE